MHLVYTLTENVTTQITTEGNNSTVTITSGSTEPNTGSTPTSPVTSDSVTTPTGSTEKVNSSTVEPNSTGTSVITSQSTTGDYSPQTSTIKTTRSPPASTSKPGFDGASFGGGIAVGVGIVIFLIIIGIVFITVKTRVKGPNYEVL
ncbi:uncharacterized protein LOC134257908 [Saccostrea cucullata]|uniref:uncharacterized protein LOC134257908 n=1 Tax=Saccostrea cuccullata TaxID=36930 RepID=UPI002ED20391